ncbi:MAG: hypothetical protein GWN00_19915 [Aliifodinibius sp.]|nr:hypothetical protein [Fodinibius sp.]NIY26988.1 hypothetical protein [Fodinibius sp.]
MKISIDGMRRSATGSMNALADTISSLLDSLPDWQAEELKESFDEAARNVDIFNCVYRDDDELFNDISEEIEVKRLNT